MVKPKSLVNVGPKSGKVKRAPPLNTLIAMHAHDRAVRDCIVEYRR
jgi:hypothetical protein